MLATLYARDRGRARQRRSPRTGTGRPLTERDYAIVRMRAAEVAELSREHAERAASARRLSRSAGGIGERTCAGGTSPSIRAALALSFLAGYNQPWTSKAAPRRHQPPKRRSVAQSCHRGQDRQWRGRSGIRREPTSTTPSRRSSMPGAASTLTTTTSRTVDQCESRRSRRSTTLDAAVAHLMKIRGTRSARDVRSRPQSISRYYVQALQ